MKVFFNAGYVALGHGADTTRIGCHRSFLAFPPKPRTRS